MPTIVYWPKKVASGVSNALWSQVDLYAITIGPFQQQPDQWLSEYKQY